MKAFRFILLVVSAVLMSGCVVFPVPHYNASGRNVTEQCSGKVQPGVDTIETVLLKLGEPDVVSGDERTLVYGSRKVIGQWWVPLVDTDGSNAPDISRFSLLTVRFDGRGVVTKTEFSQVLDF